MPISSSNIATVTVDGPSDWVALREGENLLSITAEAWDTGCEWDLLLSDDATEATTVPGEDSGGAISRTGKGARLVVFGSSGSSYARLQVAGIGTSTPINLKRLSPS